MIQGPRPVKPSEYPSLIKLINSTLLGRGDTRGMEELYPVPLANPGINYV